MTFNEAKDVFLNRGCVEVEGGQIFDGDKWRQCIVVISEWLKQQPCDDVISRQSDIENLPPVTPQQEYGDIAKAFQFGLAFGFGEKHDEMDKIIEEVKKAATPKPKIGHWINGDEKCPCCGKSKFEGLDADIWADWQPKYCPNCGTRMERNAGMTNGEYVTRIVEQGEDFCVLTDDVDGTVTIEVSLDWWNKPHTESEDKE